MRVFKTHFNKKKSGFQLLRNSGLPRSRLALVPSSLAHPFAVVLKHIPRVCLIEKPVAETGATLEKFGAALRESLRKVERLRQQQKIVRNVCCRVC